MQIHFHVCIPQLSAKEAAFSHAQVVTMALNVFVNL